MKNKQNFLQRFWTWLTSDFSTIKSFIVVFGGVLLILAGGAISKPYDGNGSIGVIAGFLAWIGLLIMFVRESRK